MMDWNGLELPANPYYSDDAVIIYHGDCREILPTLPDDSVDLVLTDPPYGIGFMGKDWDKALPDKQIWAECFRVLKDGAFAFVMSIPRADCLSRMIISLEDAGFWVNFTPIFWAYASGFPKAQNIGKAVDKRNGRNQDTYKPFADYLKSQRKAKQLSMAQIDGMLGTNTAYSWWEGRAAGIQLPTKFYYLQLKEILELDNRFDELIEREEAEREIVGERIAPDGKPYSERQPTQWTPQFSDSAIKDVPPPMITKPTTPQAKALDGSYGGFQPKPAVEVVIVAMKPLSEKTFVEQALKNRKGITWLDDGRIPIDKEADKSQIRTMNRGVRPVGDGWGLNDETPDKPQVVSPQGRFPANLLVSDAVLNDGKITQSGKDAIRRQEGMFVEHHLGGVGNLQVSHPDSGSFSRYFDLDKWFEEKIKQLPASVQKTSPFLIVPKASRGEKEKGLDNFPQVKCRGDYKDSSEFGLLEKIQNSPRPTAKNFHPTVKPLKLMSYLITLGSRSCDVVLDPFVGSGTTPLACQLLNRKCIGIEIEEKYCEIAANRCRQSVMRLNI